MVFKESRLEFTFNDEFWKPIIQYDEHPDYTKKLMKQIKETKAVDFIGCLKSDIYFFEVKNFKNYRIENKDRTNYTGEDLMEEVAQKVRDSLAGIIGGCLNSTNDKELWREILNKIQSEKSAIKVILWWEIDSGSIENDEIRKRNKNNRNKVGIGTYQQKLCGKLNWLVPTRRNINIFNLKNYPSNLEMTVCNLSDEEN